MITWLHDTSNELIKDNINDLKKITKINTMRLHGSRIRRQMSSGPKPWSRR